MAGLKKILLVDDDGDLREALAEQLTATEDFEVLEAGSGHEAVERTKSAIFDLVVLDVMMPGEDGFSLTRDLRRRNQTPILLLTARGELDDRIAGLEAGADDVVTQEDGSVEVYTSFADFLSVNEALTEAGFKGDEAEVAMIPSIMAPITDVETAQKVLRLIDALEDLDDVQNVYHNAEIADEIMQQLS